MLISRRRTLTLLSASALAACAAGVEGEEAAAGAPLMLTPGETEGPFYPTVIDERDADLTRLTGRTERAAGQVIEVRGRVLNRAGQPISGARVELWQANAAGRYDHPSDAANPSPLDPNFQGFAAIQTAADGTFSATTIKPGGYTVREMGNAQRTPHLHWRVEGGGQRLTTQSYFPNEPANDVDFLIRAMRRDDVPLLIARPGAAGAEGVPGFDWDILLAT
jgi:protocatechuate 3,4-dioxygenase, beta subunit